MNLSQKCQYAVRAVYELAKRQGSGEPSPTSQIARSQAIPARFLEAILSQLRQGGFVESRRGVQGGYVLTTPAGTLRVGDVIRYIDGPFHPVSCMSDGAAPHCRLQGTCVFIGLWHKARVAVDEAYSTTFEQLLQQEQTCENGLAQTYEI